MADRSPPSSRRARARVALSLAAARLSDSAGELVPASSDASRPPGWFVEETVRMGEVADEVLSLAVILERERGTPWEVIGGALRVTRESALERFGPAAHRWREAVRPAGAAAPGLPDGAEAPDVWASRLDEWALRRGPAGALPGDLHSVSAGLPRASMAEEITAALAELRSLADAELQAAGAASAPGEERRARRAELLERLADLFGRLAAGQPDNRAFADAAAAARHRLRELRDGRGPRSRAGPGPDAP